MSKKLGVALVLCFALALCFMLAGCGGIDKSKFVGDWHLASSTNENLDAESIALMKSLGLDVKLTLSDDGSGKLDMFGEQKNLSWEASSNTGGKVRLDNAETAMSLDNGQLTLADVEGSSLTFSR